MIPFLTLRNNKYDFFDVLKVEMYNQQVQKVARSNFREKKTSHKPREEKSWFYTFHFCNWH